MLLRRVPVSKEPFKDLRLLLLNHITPPAPKCPQENLPFPVFKANKNYIKHIIGVRPAFESGDLQQVG